VGEGPSAVPDILDYTNASFPSWKSNHDSSVVSPAAKIPATLPDVSLHTKAQYARLAILLSFLLLSEVLAALNTLSRRPLFGLTNEVTKEHD